MTATSLRNTAPIHGRSIFFSYMAVVIVAGFAAVAITLLTTPVAWYDITEAPGAVWLMALLAIAAELRPVFPPGARYSQTAMTSLCLIMALLPLWGYLPALIVQTVVAVLIFATLRARLWRTVFNVAQFSLALTAAHLTLLAMGMSTSIADAPGSAMVPMLASGAVWFLVSHLLVCTAWALRAAMSWWRPLVESFGSEALVHGASLALAPILAVAASIDSWLVPLAAVPMFAVHRLSQLSTDRERMLLSDPLTGLPNRKGFQQLVEQNLARTRDGRMRFAIVVCDVDRFSSVNNSLGHDVGDELLYELKRRFVECCDRPGEVVARTGGDEFAILLSEIPDAEYARLRAWRLREALSDPVCLDQVSLDASGALGVACYPDDGTDFDALFRRASVAMFEAKSRGSGVACYEPEFDHHSPERLALLGDLRMALETPELPGVELYYQPQVDIETGEVLGVEALLRYQHPRQGSVDPSDLIALAEHSAVMRILTYRVIDEALRQLARWNAEGLRLRTAVNVSVRDLHAQDFCDYVTERLKTHGVRPGQLQVELTESALMVDPRRVVSTLKRLEAMGVGLSLDDFGTGFSSMKHLRSLQVSEVKIDKSFVLGMREDAGAAAIVRSIIELGRSLGLRVVAEGVEDEPTYRELSSLGCDTAQGWFHARPMPAEDLASWLSRYRPPVALRTVAAESTVANI